MAVEVVAPVPQSSICSPPQLYPRGGDEGIISNDQCPLEDANDSSDIADMLAKAQAMQQLGAALLDPRIFYLMHAVLQ